MIQIYLNGTNVLEGVILDLDINDNASTYIGASSQNASDAYRYFGYVNSLKWTRGIAKYSGNFTPKENLSKYNQTETVLLGDQYNKWVFGSKLPVSSKMNDVFWMNGDTDYIMLNDSMVNRSKGTIEFVFEAHSTGTQSNPVYIWGGLNSSAEYMAIALVSQNVVLIRDGSIITLAPLSLYSPIHIALTFDNAVTVFVNGNICYTGSSVLYGSQSLGLLVDEDNTLSVLRFTGFVTNYRALSGVVLYTGQFTPTYSLSNYVDSSQRKIVDPGNQLKIGDFIGQLDDLSLFDVSLSNSHVSNIYDTAYNKTYTLEKTSGIYQYEKGDRMSNSMYFGSGRIYGTVKDKDNNPLQRKLLLLDRAQVVVAETTSRAIDGFYEFTRLSKDVYFTVIAQEKEDYRFNSIIRDFVKAE